MSVGTLLLSVGALLLIRLLLVGLLLRLLISALLVSLLLGLLISLLLGLLDGGSTADLAELGAGGDFVSAISTFHNLDS